VLSIVSHIALQPTFPKCSAIQISAFTQTRISLIWIGVWVEDLV